MWATKYTCPGLRSEVCLRVWERRLNLTRKGETVYSEHNGTLPGHGCSHNPLMPTRSTTLPTPGVPTPRDTPFLRKPRPISPLIWLAQAL